jgi:Tfp pilus assembly protein PilX
MIKIIKEKKGFTLLVAIIVTSMLTLISFAVVNIAVKQLILANSNEESQHAFYNADSGVECAVYWDFNGGPGGDTSAFDPAGPTAITCDGETVTPTLTPPSSTATTTFTINLAKGCFVVQVGKHPDAEGTTIIDSKGYNTCGASLRKLERGEKLSYANPISVGGGGGGGTETVWVEDSNSASYTSAVPGLTDDSWTWVSSSPAPFSGTEAHRSDIFAGVHQHYFENSASPLVVNTGDNLFVYVYLYSSNPPTEIMLQWNSNSQGWNHRAYWKASSPSGIGWGSEGSNSLRYIGTLPAGNTWVKLTIPASSVGLEGETVNGIAFTLDGGRVTWDKAGKETP